MVRRKAKEIHCCFTASSTCYREMETYTPCLTSYSGPKSLQTSRGSKNQKEKKPVLAQLLQKEGLQHIKQEYDFVDDFKRTRFQSKYLVAADAASALFECDRSKA